MEKLHSSSQFGDMDSSSSDLDKEIEKMQNAFYSESGGKNIFFKNTQKYNCASHLTSKIPLQSMLERMCMVLPGDDCIYISYPTFKTFAHPDVFNEIISYILLHLDYLQNKRGRINVIMDLNGFSVSAAGRYMEFIKLLCNSCFGKNASYIDILNNFTVYNCPTVIDTIQNMIMPFVEHLPTSNVDIILKNDTKRYTEKIAPYFASIHN
jgi:hypothetical protein